MEGVNLKLNKLQENMFSLTTKIENSLTKVEAALNVITDKVAKLGDEINTIHQVFITKNEMKKHLQEHYVSCKQLKTTLQLVFLRLFSTKGLLPQNGNYAETIDRILIDVLKQTFPLNPQGSNSSPKPTK